MTGVLRVLVVLVAAAVQLPVGDASMAGTIRDSSGAALPGVSIRVTNTNTGQSVETTTGADGRYAIRGLTPGPYKVTVSLAGFSVIERDALLAAGSAGGVDVTFGEIVPIGEPKRPSSGSGSSSPTTPPATIEVPWPFVIEGVHASDVDLQRALNDLPAHRRRLVSILPLRDGASLFVLAQSPAGAADQYFVVALDKPLDANVVSERVALYPGRTLVGAHRLGARSFLLVFVQS